VGLLRALGVRVASPETFANRLEGGKEVLSTILVIVFWGERALIIGSSLWLLCSIGGEHNKSSPFRNAVPVFVGELFHFAEERDPDHTNQHL
jgi:hypothetical protein